MVPVGHKAGRRDGKEAVSTRTPPTRRPSAADVLAADELDRLLANVEALRRDIVRLRREQQRLSRRRPARAEDGALPAAGAADAAHAAAAAGAPPTHEAALLRLAASRPLLRAREVLALGVPTMTLTRLVAAGKLRRVARGVYALGEGDTAGHRRRLAEVALRAPGRVVCLLSALHVHGLLDAEPPEVWLAIPPTRRAPAISSPPLRCVRYGAARFAQGVEELHVDGVRVAVYGAAKTVADCWRHRDLVGPDVAAAALARGLATQRFTVDDLLHHAQQSAIGELLGPLAPLASASRPLRVPASTDQQAP